MTNQDIKTVREALENALRDDTGDKYNDYDTLYYAIEQALAALDRVEGGMADEKTQALLNKMAEALHDLLDCPRWIDEATIPKAGIEAAPQQVVVNMSVAWLKIQALKEITALIDAKIGGGK